MQALRAEMAAEKMRQDARADRVNAWFALLGAVGASAFGCGTWILLGKFEADVAERSEAWESLVFLLSMVSFLGFFCSASAFLSLFKDGTVGRMLTRAFLGRWELESRAMREVDPGERIRDSLRGALSHALAAGDLALVIREAPPDSAPPLLHAVALRISRMHDKERVWEGMASLRAALGDEGAAALIDLFLSARAALDGGARRVEIDGATNEILHRAAAWADIDGREGTEGARCACRAARGGEPRGVFRASRRDGTAGEPPDTGGLYADSERGGQVMDRKWVEARIGTAIASMNAPPGGGGSWEDLADRDASARDAVRGWAGELASRAGRRMADVAAAKAATLPAPEAGRHSRGGGFWTDDGGRMGFVRLPGGAGGISQAGPSGRSGFLFLFRESHSRDPRLRDFHLRRWTSEEDESMEFRDLMAEWAAGGSPPWAGCVFRSHDMLLLRADGTVRLNFTHAILVGRIGNSVTYDDRWCYSTRAAAEEALEAWDGRGEPTGWHRHPATGRRVDKDGNMTIHM